MQLGKTKKRHSAQQQARLGLGVGPPYLLQAKSLYIGPKATTTRRIPPWFSKRYCVAEHHLQDAINVCIAGLRVNHQCSLPLGSHWALPRRLYARDTQSYNSQRCDFARNIHSYHHLLPHSPNSQHHTSVSRPHQRRHFRIDRRFDAWLAF